MYGMIGSLVSYVEYTARATNIILYMMHNTVPVRYVCVHLMRL